jgi:hypothetical protein
MVQRYTRSVTFNDSLKFYKVSLSQSHKVVKTKKKISRGERISPTPAQFLISLCEVHLKQNAFQ